MGGEPDQRSELLFHPGAQSFPGVEGAAVFADLSPANSNCWSWIGKQALFSFSEVEFRPAWRFWRLFAIEQRIFGWG